MDKKSIRRIEILSDNAYVHFNNKAAIFIAHNLVPHDWTKHIEIKLLTFHKGEDCLRNNMHPLFRQRTKLQMC